MRSVQKLYHYFISNYERTNKTKLVGSNLLVDAEQISSLLIERKSLDGF